MACRFPGAPSVETFWSNLCGGVEAISFFSAEELRAAGVDPAAARDSSYVPAGAVLDGIELFDAEFFGVAAREAEIMDPQHRLFLECAWEALESGGYDPARYDGAIGVYAGAARNTYLLSNLLPDPGLLDLMDGFQVSIGSDNDYLATRVSYKLDLRGPSVTVQTASSTALVAVHLACRALQAGDCDLALAGGVAIKVPQRVGHRYKTGGVRSRDGHTRAFDADAHGTVFGSGVGVVVLKPLQAALADGDHVHAVILGSAVNNDGARKRGYTAPSAEAVAAVVAKALADAAIHPDTVGYLEAHATGTAVGDPLELAALTEAFSLRTARRGFCALGSVKTNIGHPGAAAGVAGLIKTALALEHRRIPPTLNFRRPHPGINLAAGPFYVNTALREWPPTEGVPRRAGVNALGFGGTNAHVVLEEAPPQSASGSASRPWQLLVLSARTGSALDATTANLARYLREHPDCNLADVAYTLQLGRREFTHRRILTATSAEDASAALELPDPARVGTAEAAPGDRSMAFMFPGHGSQHVNMMRGLYQGEPLFRCLVDACAERLEPLLQTDLRQVLFPPQGKEEFASQLLAQTRYAQPALFTVEYALGRLWIEWGVRPQALIGYSIGEYASACLAGVFDLDDALTVVAARAGLAQRVVEGAMLAVALREEALLPLLGDGLSLAAVSSPVHCVAAGLPEPIEELRGQLLRRGVACKRLTLARAFHSAMMEPVLDEYREVVSRVRLRPPTLDLVSGVTGTWLRPEEAIDPEYWVREVRETVRFSQGVSTLATAPRRVFLEVGPGNLLSALVRGHPDVTGDHVVVPSCRAARDSGPDQVALLDALGGLWLAGLPVEWSRLHTSQRRRIPLPTYPFERQRYWIDAPAAAPPPRSSAEQPSRSEGASGAASPPAVVSSPSDQRTGRPRPRLATPYVAPGTPVEHRIAALWRELLGVREIGVHDRLFELGGDSLLAVQLISRVRDALQVDIPLSAFFKAPTVSTLAGLALGTLAQHAGGDEATRLLREIDRRPPDESHGRPTRQSPPIARYRETISEPPAPRATGPQGDLCFSLFFFSGDESAFGDDRYRLVMEGAKFADQHGFAAVWTPERHFDKFGGLYPNPAVLGAAIAAVTDRIQIRAGSVVVPLHHPVRIAEEWAVVDNLSHGRVGLAFASGFHPPDFVLGPDNFADRRAVMLRGIDTVRRLWRGESVRLRGGQGHEADIRIFPRPVQLEPPIWLAATQSVETFTAAGRIGANVLTALLRFGIDELADRIASYRESLQEHGHDPHAGIVTVMLHTYLGSDLEEVRSQAARPLVEYLRSHLAFLLPMGTGAGPASDPTALTAADREALVAHAFERFSTTQALIGTPEGCLPAIERLAAIGVNEVACLIDFGMDFEAAMQGLHHLCSLRELVAGRRASRCPQGLASARGATR